MHLDGQDEAPQLPNAPLESARALIVALKADHNCLPVAIAAELRRLLPPEADEATTVTVVPAITLAAAFEAFMAGANRRPTSDSYTGIDTDSSRTQLEILTLMMAKVAEYDLRNLAKAFEFLDSFPASIGGGGFTGFDAVRDPQAKKLRVLLVNRLLAENPQTNGDLTTFFTLYAKARGTACFTEPEIAPFQVSGSDVNNKLAAIPAMKVK